MDDDESTYEINQLLKKLDSKRSGHKDRIRALTRFRNFVSNSKNTPEFYDDDIPYLLIGTKEDAHVDTVRSSTVPNSVGGLFHACGGVSHAHKGSLKRSARTAMALLKYLVCDFVEVSDGKPTGEENLFASSYLEVTQHHLLLFESHISGDSSSRAAKDDACALLCELLMQSKNSLSLEDYLPTSSKACDEFEKWVSQNKSKAVQQALKKHNVAGPATNKLLKQSSGVDETNDDVDGDILGAFTKRKKVSTGSDDEDDDVDENALGGVQSQDRKSSNATNGHGAQPTAWVDSELAKEDLTGASLERGLEHDKVQREAELKRQEEEKQRLLRKDPLGIREDLDMLYVEEKRVELLELALEEVEQEMDLEFKNQARGSSARKNEREHLASLEVQRESLEAILDGRSKAAKDGDDNQNASEEAKDVEQRSVLPTESTFDPLLFLTLAHRNADFDQLQKCIARISSKYYYLYRYNIFSLIFNMYSQDNSKFITFFFVH